MTHQQTKTAAFAFMAVAGLVLLGIQVYRYLNQPHAPVAGMVVAGLATVFSAYGVWHTRRRRQP